MHYELFTKVIAIDINRFDLNIPYNLDKSDLQTKKSGPCGLDEKEIITLISLRLTVK